MSEVGDSEDSKDQIQEWSGEDSDVEENAQAPEENEQEVEEANHTRTRFVAGKEKADIEPTHVIVLGNFYAREDEQFQLSLPRLPPVNTKLFFNNPEDYSEFTEKMSSWFSSTEKRVLKKAGAPKEKRSFECRKCDWSFDSAAKLNRHKDVHRNIGTFACQVCFVLFAHSYNIYNHWRKTCSQISIGQPDANLNGFTVQELRKCVLKAMGADNRAQQYHAFGGSIFIPSQAFVKDKYNVIAPHHQSTCHLCHLIVPIKFLECHGDVHRGRYRIDGSIYGEYFCHICACIFKEKKNLLLHWRHDCAETVYYTPEDVYLDDEELVALTWLILQSTIAGDQILAMARNFSLMVENSVRKHAEEYGLENALDRYYHFPQEIWPLPLNVGLDFIEDSFPILGEGAFAYQGEKEMTINNPNIPIHITNLLATVAPDFYATGMAFTEISSAQEEAHQPRSVFRMVLRYTTSGSIISTYKLNARTCPSLRPTKLSNTKFQSSDYDVEAPFKVEIPEAKRAPGAKLTDSEKYMYSVEWACEARLTMYKERTSLKKPPRLCQICMKLIGMRCPREHWKYKCPPLKVIIESEEERECVDDRLATVIAAYISKIPAKISYEWPKYENDEKKKREREQAKETVDRLGEIHKVSFQISDRNLAKLRKVLIGDIDLAKKRYEERLETKENFNPIDAPIVVCIHCGGRYHHLQLFSHLEHRHFWPALKNLERRTIDAWRKDKCKDTYKLLSDLIEESDPVIEMIVMSQSKYEKCIACHSDEAYNEDSDNSELASKQREIALHPWSEEQTLREVEILDKLITMPPPKQGTTSVVSTPFNGVPIFYPPIKMLEQPAELDSEEDEEMPAEPVNPENQISLTVNGGLVDPYTGEPLPDELCPDIIEQTREYFGDNLDAAKEHGFEFITMCGFPKPPEKKDKNGVSEAEKVEEILNLEEFDRENSEGEEEEEPQIELDEFENDDEDTQTFNLDDDDNDDDEVYYESDEEKEEAADARRAYQKKQELRRAAMCRIVKSPEPYDEEMFKPREYPLNPALMKNLGNLLSKVDMSDGEGDESMDDGDDEEEENSDEFGNGKSEILALCPSYENSVSDFRISGTNFRLWSKKQFPEVSNGISVDQLSEEERAVALEYDQLRDENDPPVGVVDLHGTAYMNGFILEIDENVKDHLRKTYVIRNGYARDVQIFHCQDKYGPFRFIWPHNPKVNMQEIAINLERIVFRRREGPANYDAGAAPKNTEDEENPVVEAVEEAVEAVAEEKIEEEKVEEPVEEIVEREPSKQPTEYETEEESEEEYDEEEEEEEDDEEEGSDDGGIVIFAPDPEQSEGSRRYLIKAWHERKKYPEYLQKKLYDLAVLTKISKQKEAEAKAAKEQGKSLDDGAEKSQEDGDEPMEEWPYERIFPVVEALRKELVEWRRKNPCYSEDEYGSYEGTPSPRSLSKSPEPPAKRPPEPYRRLESGMPTTSSVLNATRKSFPPQMSTPGPSRRPETPQRTPASLWMSQNHSDDVEQTTSSPLNSAPKRPRLTSPKVQKSPQKLVKTDSQASSRHSSESPRNEDPMAMTEIQRQIAKMRREFKP